MSGFSSVQTLFYLNKNFLFLSKPCLLKSEYLSITFSFLTLLSSVEQTLIFYYFLPFVSRFLLITRFFFISQKPYIHLFLQHDYVSTSLIYEQQQQYIKPMFFLFQFFFLTLLLYGDKVSSNFNSYIQNNFDEEMLLQEILREPVGAANR